MSQWTDDDERRMLLLIVYLFGKHKEMTKAISLSRRVMEDLDEVLERVTKTLEQIEKLAGINGYYMDEIGRAIEDLRELPGNVTREFRDDVRNLLLDMANIKLKANGLWDKFKRLREMSRTLSAETEKLRDKSMQVVKEAGLLNQEYQEVIRVVEMMEKDPSSIDPELEIRRLEDLKSRLTPVVQDLMDTVEGLVKVMVRYNELGDRLNELLLEVSTLHSLLEGVVRRFNLGKPISASGEPEVIVNGDVILVVMELSDAREDEVNARVERDELVIEVRGKEIRVNLPGVAEMVSKRVVNDTLTINLRKVR
ncbi:MULTISPECIES: hypothetical protein [Metallosphaera]|uniref:Uncharacterized protein n=3 Tax=Metallosphaera TaxID=41980 RepID=A4YFR6_METS5|nr:MULTISPECIES: hypothetical protein [Metallosphaera]ABP95268.1 hypothetical protein Msed_1104 [Metallosphaera sedula DSM 5348]AIM27254.1 hypothetical protein HA72_1104 [Metallosphaera sedula]AKV74143.1 hypothetical protein MsedA_1118 [Metallosphaera sedula]AKV76383.1 hypothetical protein MsedB_1120 [Metallosphaera sedula]AKV78634.1 hypothetical protein MsedC_1118 [Metallosphaera sedula]